MPAAFEGGRGRSQSLSPSAAVERLEKHYGPPVRPPTTDPFELILLENVAYLARPARRKEAFEELKKTVGTGPAALLAARQQALERVTARGILKGQTLCKRNAPRCKECPLAGLCAYAAREKGTAHA